MICRGSGVGVKALRPRSGARMRGLDADPTSAKLRKFGECHSPQDIADHSAPKQQFGHFVETSSHQSSRYKSFKILVPGGGANPHEVALGGF
ncbi:hypothetical protein SAMN05444167_2434 [Terriglobus roseus]|uniref:Uncharacterized protein n=1 Tax=Terriglobus roseus TaxID=392734 RepID=A0A1G7L4V8_9BACT|nr:hypothetical protein SAMN05444167_2434 [Terriglobus roseus]